jgi:hypothetical protein
LLRFILNALMKEHSLGIDRKGTFPGANGNKPVFLCMHHETRHSTLRRWAPGTFGTPTLARAAATPTMKVRLISRVSEHLNLMSTFNKQVPEFSECMTEVDTDPCIATTFFTIFTTPVSDGFG